MEPTKAESVSVDKLSAAIDKAVRIAAERHHVKVSDKNLVLGWDIVGRKIRDGADLKANVKAFADTVASQMAGLPGEAMQPAVLHLGDEIWAGFFERSRIPLARGLI